MNSHYEEIKKKDCASRECANDEQCTNYTQATLSGFV